MFCGNCGCKNDDGATFCKECGTKLVADSNEQASYIDTPKQQQNTTSFMDVVKTIPRKILIGVSAAIVALIAIVVIAINMSSTINLDKYVEVSFEGYDGYGRASVSVDWDSIEKKYASKLSYTKKAKSEYRNLLSYTLPMDFMEEYVSIEIDKNTNLKNGDEISYTWNIDEEELSSYLKCKIKFKDDSVSVFGLTEVTTFDPFEDLSVTFSGVDPVGSMSMEYTGDMLSSYDFYCENSNELKNGDKVTVYLSSDDMEYFVEIYGKMPSVTEKEYTVSGLGKYASVLSEIDSDTSDSIKHKAEEVINESTSSWSSDAGIDSVNYVGCYLQVAKEKSAYSNNIFGVVYEIVSHVQASEDTDVVNVVQYYYVQFNNIVVAADKSCEVDLDDYSTPSESFSKKAYYENNSFSYNNYYYYGFETLLGLKGSHVDSNVDEFATEWKIEDEEKYSLTSENVERLCAYSSERQITETEASEYLNVDCSAYGFPGERNIIQMIINEMYALKGYQFSDEELQNYFNQKEWYVNTENKADDMDSIYANMSEIEKANITLLEQYK